MLSFTEVPSENPAALFLGDDRYLPGDIVTVIIVDENEDEFYDELDFNSLDQEDQEEIDAMLGGDLEVTSDTISLDYLLSYYDEVLDPPMYQV